ncbi:MAG: hypothetical protein QM817_39935 [Archangium sp.]
MTRISPGFRVALAGKALLLLGFAGLFALMAWSSFTRWHWPLLARVSGSALLAIGALAIASAALRGLADAILGDAETTRGAKPLKSRRSGYSLQLPNGKFVEYVLYNPWPALAQDQTYTVTYGKFSRVLVARPLPE